MKKTLIVGATVLADGELKNNRALLIGGGKILEADYRGSAPEDAEIINADGCYLLPSFIELHAHGGGGFDFADCTAEAFDGVMNTHRAHGVGLLCPTLVATRWEKTLDFLKFCDTYAKRSSAFGGVHLEGPFLSPLMCGAQAPASIIAPTESKVAELEEFASLLSCVTAAPEVEGVGLLARRMRARGVSMSIGHSNADSPTVEKAADLGFERITHLFSSTSRRAKQGSYVIGGIEESALIDDRFTVELIGDGHHVSRESFLLTEKCKGKDRVVLVSDGMRAAGQTGLTESFLGEVVPENRVIIEDGVAKLPDRSSFAGSIACGDTMVQALCGAYGLPLATVSHMMSTVPARLLGLTSRGRIARGLDAELVLLDKNYKTVMLFDSTER